MDNLVDNLVVLLCCGGALALFIYGTLKDPAGGWVALSVMLCGILVLPVPDAPVRVLAAVSGILIFVSVLARNDKNSRTFAVLICLMQFGMFGYQTIILLA